MVYLLSVNVLVIVFPGNFQQQFYYILHRSNLENGSDLISECGSSCKKFRVALVQALINIISINIITMRKVLVVDENSEILLIVQILLHRYGFLVESVTRASDLEKKIIQFDPGLLIMDVKLEGGDGRDICRNLKTNRLTSHVPIILFSSDASVINDFQECNADDFISKPFDINKFVANVKNIFDRSTSALN